MEGDRRLRSHRSRFPVGSRLLQFIRKTLGMARMGFSLRLEALHDKLHLTMGFSLEASTGLSMSNMGLLGQTLLEHRDLRLHGQLMSVTCSLRVSGDALFVRVDGGLSARLNDADGTRRISRFLLKRLERRGCTRRGRP